LLVWASFEEALHTDTGGGAVIIAIDEMDWSNVESSAISIGKIPLFGCSAVKKPRQIYFNRPRSFILREP